MTTGDINTKFLPEISGDLLLLSGTDNEGLTTSLKAVRDGEGNTGPLKLSTALVAACDWQFSGALLRTTALSGGCAIKLGQGRTNNDYSYIDLIGDATYTDYGTRLIRHAGGPDTASELIHRGTGPLRLSAIEAGQIELWTSTTRRATVLSTGELCVGNQIAWSPVDGNVDGMTWRPGYGLAILAGSGASMYVGTNHSSRPFIGFQFYKGPGNIHWAGSITTDGTSTFFNTSSDYRLKENIATLPSQIDKIMMLRPVAFTWKSAPELGASQGFIAHELAEVFPGAVWGEKDATDSDGKIMPQSVDAAKLVPALVRAVQDGYAMILALQTEVAALKARIEVLEGNT